MKKIAVIGSAGYLGSNIFTYLNGQGYSCIGIARSGSAPGVINCDVFDTDRLEKFLVGSDVVINCVGYAHSISKKDAKSEDTKHRIQNYESVVSLVKSCQGAGVSKIINISTVKVIDILSTEQVQSDYYAYYKRLAEKYLIEVTSKYNLKIVNLRIPMIFGRNSKGYLPLMARYIKMGIFPPIPETYNRRSMLHIDDLMTAIEVSIINESVNGRSLTVSSMDGLSGRQIYSQLRRVYGLSHTSLEIPETALIMAAKFCDQLEKILRRNLPYNSPILSKLLDDSYYSPKEFMDLTGWKPKMPLLDRLIDF